MPRLISAVFVVALVGLLVGGCGSMLPVAKTRSEARWGSFEESKAVFDQIIPYRTSRADLQELHFDPSQTPNIQIMTYPEIIQLFMPNSSFDLREMDPGLRLCVAESANCQAFQLNLHRLESERHGNVFLDLFRFKRQTHQTGWRFTSLVVLVEDQVVYKLWGGVPRVDEHLYQKNPLGPLQEPADTARDAALFGVL
ncbi:hypothetical protein [Desulfurivibrio sp. C05AmB]|uniref:hypothetical protein n=1 Tax=Desulfurivibrio sp. C05AmB TaxID=3374371 RepID=UPI00376EC546